jgi:hypothetical protein
MRYILYRTTCKVNNKYYIGKHRTENIDDGYLGSGILLARAIEKYGRNAFERQILGEFHSEQDLQDAERKAITEDVLNDEMSYNIALGGQGGFLGEEVCEKMRNSWTPERRKAQSILWKKIRTSKNYLEAYKRRKHSWLGMTDSQKNDQAKLMSETMKELWRDPKHREKMKSIKRALTSEAFRLATRGKKWICKPDGTRRMIDGEESQKFINEGWRLGRVWK